MRTTMLVLGGTLAAAAVGAPIARAQQATPAAEPTHRFEVEFDDTILAASQNGLDVGDRIVLHDRLLQGGQQVGHDGGVCTVTDPAGGETLCVVTFSLPGGTLSTQFLNTPPPEKAFAVLGGTGDYAGATGHGTLLEHPDQTGDLAFFLD